MTKILGLDYFPPSTSGESPPAFEGSGILSFAQPERISALERYLEAHAVHVIVPEINTIH